MATQPVDTRALVADIEREVSRRRAAGEYPEALLERLRAEFRVEVQRDPIEALAQIVTHHLPERPGRLGDVIRLGRKVLRRGMAWYVQPIAVQQTAFNFAAAAEIRALERRVARLETPWAHGAGRVRGVTAGDAAERDAARLAAWVDAVAVAPPGVVLWLGPGRALTDRLSLPDHELRIPARAAAEIGPAALDPIAQLEAGEDALAAVIVPGLLPSLSAADLLSVVPLALARLQPGGVLVLDAPDAAHASAPRDPSGLDPAMLRYVSAETAALLCEAAGAVEVRSAGVGAADASGVTPWWVVTARRAEG